LFIKTALKAYVRIEV